MQKASPKNTLRKLVLYLILVNSISWAGLFMAVSDGSEETRDLSLMIWLISPFLVSIIIRLISRDWIDLGLKPRQKNNGKWYLFSLLVFPVMILIILSIGRIFGAISFIGFRSGLFARSLATGFIFTFVKNISEEFSWRGFMTPKMNGMVKKSLYGHLITGLFWGLWHIPYYLVLLDRASLAGYTSLEMSLFLPFMLLGITAAGIIFGEIRLITKSTWPAVLMHTISNILTVTLLTEGHILLNGNTELIFTPGWHGCLSIVIVFLAGCLVYKTRTRSTGPA